MSTSSRSKRGKYLVRSRRVINSAIESTEEEEGEEEGEEGVGGREEEGGREGATAAGDSLCTVSE